jgi:Helix-turn-helix domain
MARRGQTTNLAERVEIGERWQAGQKDPEIAVAMNLPVWTVRKWRRKYQKQGRSGLDSRMGRPRTGALGQSPLELRDTIRDMREAHPGWGPITIRTELEDMSHFTGLQLPSRSRIAAFLRQQGLTRKYERHVELPQPRAADPQRAHEEWEMDAQGAIKVPELGPVSVINITDLFSRVKVGSLPCLNPAHPSTQDYQLALRQAFVHYGLPQRISLDHDSVFFDNTHASPFPSVLHLWLIALGVEVRFIDKRPPVEHSVIERCHQTVSQQAIAGQYFSDELALRESLAVRCDFLNTRYPSRSLAGQPPLIAHPEARHSGCFYRLEWEEDLLAMQRVHDYLAKGRWFRRSGPVGLLSLGHHRYGVGRAFGNQTFEVTFDSQTLEWICLPADGRERIRIPAQGLTKSALMGELSPLLACPAYQLALPISPSAWRQMTLANNLTGTTL